MREPAVAWEKGGGPYEERSKHNDRHQQISCWLGQSGMANWLEKIEKKGRGVHDKKGWAKGATAIAKNKAAVENQDDLCKSESHGKGKKNPCGGREA